MTGLASVLQAAMWVHASNPVLREFTDWPADLPATGKPERLIPATDLVAGFGVQGNVLPHPLVSAIIANAALCHWIRTYSEAEVGMHFRANYGYYELVGPAGHFHSDTLRAYVAYWGPGLHYDWHRHEAEELYLCLAGGGVFHAEGRDPVTVGPGDTIYHAGNQPHAMTTTYQPILCLILWRGAGLAGLPSMDVT